LVNLHDSDGKRDFFPGPKEEHMEGHKGAASTTISLKKKRCLCQQILQQTFVCMILALH